MARYGSDESGFSVELNGSLLRVRGWGFWDAALAEQLGPGVLSVCPALIRPLRLLCDLGQLKPQEDHAQQALRSLLAALARRGLVNAAVVVTNTLTRIQLKNITKELTTVRWVYIGTLSAADEQLSTPLGQEERK